MKYAVYLRRVTDGRAPERVDLMEEYRKLGVLEATGVRDVERILASMPEVTSKFTGETRRIQIGDVIIEQVTHQSYIYTPTGSWAIVKLIKE